MNKDTERNTMFQHLVLNGIWMLFLAIRGYDNHQGIHSWRDGAIYFGDEYGVSGDDAKRIRRELTYKLPPNT
jgi:hypothetical protein